jgi:hypothetical protein
MGIFNGPGQVPETKKPTGFQWAFYTLYEQY